MQSSPAIELTRRRRVIHRLLSELASADADDEAYERKLELLGRRIAHHAQTRTPAAPVARPGASRTPATHLRGWGPVWRRQMARFDRLGAALLKVFRRAPSLREHATGDQRPSAAQGVSGVVKAPAMSDACAVSAGRRVGRLIGRFEHGFFGDRSSRSYMLYQPAFRASGQAPLLVMLHGCNQSADEFAAGTRMNEAAEDAGVVVLYPEQSVGAHALRCWNWYALQDTSNNEGDAALIAHLTREVMREQDIDPARVYIAGMSAGGAMAAVLARDYPQLFAALGVHSGVPAGHAHDAIAALHLMSVGPEPHQDERLSPAEHRAPGVPSIVFHGDADRTVHPSNADALYAAAGAPDGGRNAPQAWSATLPAGDGHHSFTRSADFGPKGVTCRELWIVHGAEHAWTGGNGGQRHTDALGPDASREMMRFFLQHSLQA
jgi:poly(hydroxyalkanoate) depolymerase family esterase